MEPSLALYILAETGMSAPLPVLKKQQQLGVEKKRRELPLRGAKKVRRERKPKRKAKKWRRKEKKKSAAAPPRLSPACES